jgi:hypothetical protein
MPTVPSYDVTQAQADRMIAAHGSVAEYRAWRKATDIAFVVEKERLARLKAFGDEQRARDEQTKVEMGGEPTPPST